MTANTCPIWGRAPSVQDIEDVGKICNSPRAGGDFLLMKCGAPLLQPNRLTDRQRANLSYWIYQHNLEYRRFSEQATGNPPTLNQAWVEGNRDRTPSSLDRLLTFLREMIRIDDAGKHACYGLLMAAGGCRNDSDLLGLLSHTTEQGWVNTAHDFPMTGSIRGGILSGYGEKVVGNLTHASLAARIYVEERTRELGQSRQGFVAMWFDDSMDPVYDDGIAPAIRAAGYEPYKIDEDDFTGGVVDRILAEVRKSKFVVADLTTSPASGVRGGVYFEAGFALGLDKTVFLTCRKDRTEAVHFDINHLNRIEWETSEDLREQLKNSILAVLDRGPLDPPDGQPADSGQPERTAA